MSSYLRSFYYRSTICSHCYIHRNNCRRYFGKLERNRRYLCCIRQYLNNQKKITKINVLTWNTTTITARATAVVNINDFFTVQSREMTVKDKKGIQISEKVKIEFVKTLL